MQSPGLLAAAFSSMLGIDVYPPGQAPQDAQLLGKLSIYSLFQCTYIMRPLETLGETPSEVIVKTLIGKSITIPVAGDVSVAEIKAAVCEKEGIRPQDQRLVFNRKALEDHETVEGIGIPHLGTIFLVVNVRGGGGPCYELDTSLLAPSYDYDFSGVRDGSKRFVRGGHQYNRPCGWYRCAIKVLGEYGSDEWLGPGGIRTESSPTEWPVSYHGTNMESAKKITKGGYKAGPRKLYGKGVYSSPSLVMVGELYAATFQHEGNTYKVALQNRVNPDVEGGRLKIVPGAVTVGGVAYDYWVSQQHDVSKGVYDVRPYGIVLRKL